LRLEHAFVVRLPDAVMAEAVTLRDLVVARRVVFRGAVAIKSPLAFFEGSRDLIASWGRERLYHAIRHHRKTLAGRANLADGCHGNT